MHISNLYLLSLISISIPYLCYLIFHPRSLSPPLLLSPSFLEYLNFYHSQLELHFHLVYCTASFRILRSSILGATFLGTVSGLVSFRAQLFAGCVACCGSLWVTWALPDVLFASVSQSRFNFVHALIPRSASSCFLDNLFIVCTICDNFPPTTHSRILLHFPLQFSSARGKSEKRNKAKCKSWHSQFSHVARRSLSVPSPEWIQWIHNSIYSACKQIHDKREATRGRGDRRGVLQATSTFTN